MKNRKQITAIIVSAILMLSFICQSVPVSAATNKIILNDVNGDGEVSVGDTFCLGEECFYVTKNADGQVQALSKYNLLAGYTLIDESNNSALMDAYKSGDWNAFVRMYFSLGYLDCYTHYFGQGADDYKVICYKPLDYTLEFFDYSDNELGYTVIDYTTTDINFDKCYDNGGEYDENDHYLAKVRYCLNYIWDDDAAVKQDATAISAHGDERGKMAYPEIGSYFFESATRFIKLTTDDGYNFIEWPDHQYYNDNNDLVRTKYTEEENRYRAGYYKNDIYAPVEKYNNYLTSLNYDIKDINLLSYNDLADLLTAIDNNYSFEHDGYQCPSNDWTTDENGAWRCSTSPWIWQYYDLENSSYYVGYSSMLDYIPEEYQWIYSTSYWLRTAYWNFEDGHDSSAVDEDVITREEVTNYQFFVDTLGDLCFVSGGSNCSSPSVGAGIRPVITVSLDDIEINSTTISGKIIWKDNNNALGARPQKAVLKLRRNGEVVKEIEVTDGNDEVWEFTFGDVPKYDENGDEYVYEIVQDDIARYISDVTDFEIVNEYVENPSTLAENPWFYGGIIGMISMVGVVVLRYSRR